MRIKRHFMRWQVNEDVEVKFSEVDKFIQATIHDISLMGMQISLPEELPQEKSFVLTVRLSNGTYWRVQPWVSWHLKEDDRQFYGLYFSRIQDYEKEKIWNFINDTCQEDLCVRHWDGIESNHAGQMSQEDIEDRRLYQRFRLRCPVQLSDGSDVPLSEAETVDFSAKGVGLVSGTFIAAGKSLQLWLNFPCQEEAVATRGTVAWSHRCEDDGTYRVGVNLDSGDLMGITGLIR